MKIRLSMGDMTKSITFRFISIVSLIIILWVGGLAVLIISKTDKAQSQQNEGFISALKTIQTNEELLLRDSLQKKGDSMVRLLKQTGGSLISNYDDEMLNRLARITAEDEDIAYVVFYDTEGKSLTKGAANVEGEHIETLKEEIVFEDEPTGAVELGLDFTVVEENKAVLNNRIGERIAETKQAMKDAHRYITTLTMLGCLSGVILLAISVYLVLSRVVIRPIKDTTMMIKDIAEGEGDLTRQLTVKSKDEIGELSKWFNILVTFKSVGMGRFQPEKFEC